MLKIILKNYIKIILKIILMIYKLVIKCLIDAIFKAFSVKPVPIAAFALNSNHLFYMLLLLDMRDEKSNKFAMYNMI